MIYCLEKNKTEYIMGCIADCVTFIGFLSLLAQQALKHYTKAFMNEAKIWYKISQPEKLWLHIVYR